MTRVSLSRFTGSTRLRLRLLLGAGLAALALYVLAREVEWRTTLVHLRQADPFWLFLCVISVFLNSLCKAQRWRALFPHDQPLPSRRSVFGALMAGQLLNFMLPLRSGDISRAYFMGRKRGASTASTAGTIGAEKLIDLIIVGLLFALVLPHVVLPGWMTQHSRSLLFGTLIGLSLWLGVLLTLPLMQRLLAGLSLRLPVLAPVSILASRLLDGFQALRHWRSLPVLLGWSAIVWATAVLTNLLLLEALSLPPSLLSALLAVLVIQSGVSIPLAPGQIGVFEGLAVFALSLTGVAAEPALAFGLLLHAIVFIFPLTIGLPWIIRHT